MSHDIDKFVINALQSVYGNLPQLISKVSITENISNEEAIKRVLSQFKQLTSLNYLSKRENNWTANDDKIKELQLELKYLKEFYTTGGVAAAAVLGKSGELQKLKIELEQTKRRLVVAERELVFCKRHSEAAKSKITSSDQSGSINELQTKIVEYQATVSSLESKVSELAAELELKRADYARARDEAKSAYATNRKTIDELNARLSESQNEKFKKTKQLSDIAKLLNPEEPNSDQAVRTLQSFLHKYKEQTSILQNLKKLRTSVQAKIEKSISEIVEAAPTSPCSDHDYLNEVVFLLFRESESLRDRLQNSDDENQQRLRLAESDVNRLAASLSEHKNQIEKLSERKDALESDLADAAYELKKMTEEKRALENKIEGLVSALRDIKRSMGESPDASEREEAATLAELVATNAQFSELSAQQQVKNSEIIQLQQELEELTDQWMEQRDRLSDTVSERASNLGNGELTDALRRLEEQLNTTDECLGTKNAIADIATRLMNRSSVATADLAELNALDITDPELKARIVRLNELVQHDREILDAIENTEATIERDPQNSDVLDTMQSDLSSSSSNNNDGGKMTRAWWKFRKRAAPYSVKSNKKQKKLNANESFGTLLLESGHTGEFDFVYGTVNAVAAAPVERNTMAVPILEETGHRISSVSVSADPSFETAFSPASMASIQSYDEPSSLSACDPTITNQQSICSNQTPSPSSATIALSSSSSAASSSPRPPQVITID